MLEENFPRQRIAIGVQTVRGQAENDVARLDPRAVDHSRAIDHPDNAAGEIVFAPAIHPRHLRGFAADQSAAARPTGFGETAQDLIEDRGSSFSAPM